MRCRKACTATLLLFTLPLYPLQSTPTQEPLATPSYNDIVTFLEMLESGVLERVITEPEDLAQIAYFLAVLTLAGALPEEESIVEEKIRILLESIPPIYGNQYLNLVDGEIVLCRNFVSKAWSAIKEHVAENKEVYLFIGAAALGVGIITATGGFGTPALSFLGAAGAGSLKPVPAYDHLQAMDPATRTEIVQAIRGPQNQSPQTAESVRERAFSFARKKLTPLSEEAKLEALAAAQKELDRFLEPSPQIDDSLPFKWLHVPKKPLSPSEETSAPDLIDLRYIELPTNRLAYAKKKELSPPVASLDLVVQGVLRKKCAEGNKEAERFFGDFFASPLQWHAKTPYDRDLLKECIREVNTVTDKTLLENISFSFAIKVGDKELPKLSIFFINGMQTNDLETLEIMSLISELLGGLTVAGCHNGTAGFFVDGKESLKGKIGFKQEIDAQSLVCILTELERIGPDGTMFVITHSQGGLVFYAATKSLDEALRLQMDVTTFGTGTVISSDEYREATNFIAKDDHVAKNVNSFYFVKLELNKDVTMLEPVEGSKGHSFMSPTYQRALEKLADSIRAVADGEKELPKAKEKIRHKTYRKLTQASKWDD